MPANFTIANRPAGYDQTQRRFHLSGNLAVTGTYTNGTGIVPTFNNVVDQSGNPYVLPPTYTGTNGPGQGVPLSMNVQPVAGFTVNFVGGALRIYSASGTEATTGAVPTAISAGGVPTTVTFLRG